MVQREGSSAPCSLAQQQVPCQALSASKAHLSPPVAEPLSPSSVLASPFQLSTACSSPKAAEAPEEQRLRQPLMPAQSALPHRLSMLKRCSLDWLLHRLPGWLMLRVCLSLLLPPVAAACAAQGALRADMCQLHSTLAYGSLAPGLLFIDCWLWAGGPPEDTPELDMLSTRLSSGLLDQPGPKKDLGKPAKVNW